MVQTVSENFRNEKNKLTNDLRLALEKRLGVQMKEEKKETGKLAAQACDAIVIHNTDPDLIFSPNEHYLNILVHQMVEADTGMASETVVSGISTIIYVLLSRSNVSISQNWPRKNLFGRQYWKLPGLVDLINEPSKLAQERKTLSNRKKVLEEALTYSCCL